MGLSSTLTVVFIVLRLVGVIHWSWWWVLSPSLIDVALGIAILTGVGLSMRSRRHRYERPSRWGR